MAIEFVCRVGAFSEFCGFVWIGGEVLLFMALEEGSFLNSKHPSLSAALQGYQHSQSFLGFFYVRKF